MNCRSPPYADEISNKRVMSFDINAFCFQKRRRLTRINTICACRLLPRTKALFPRINLLLLRIKNSERSPNIYSLLNRTLVLNIYINIFIYIIYFILFYIFKTKKNKIKQSKKKRVKRKRKKRKKRKNFSGAGAPHSLPAETIVFSSKIFYFPYLRRSALISSSANIHGVPRGKRR